MSGRDWTLLEQAYRLRHDFPEGRTRKLLPVLLVWTGQLTPTPLSREYTVRITYAKGHYPTVALVEPRLTPDERKLLHHLWPNGHLCVHKPDEWDPSMLLVETIIPWTADWLAHYELWKRTHQWYGDGDEGEVTALTADPPPLPKPLGSRNERRWGARAAARRAGHERRGASRLT